MDINEEVYLNAIYQNSRTAIQSIDNIISKVRDHDLLKELCSEEENYEKISQECENYAKENGFKQLKDNNFFEKARLWTSINISTMMDKSARKISELVLLGTFMGIITCMKDKSDHKNTSEKLDKICDKLYNLERGNIDKLLPYLTNNENYENS